MTESLKKIQTLDQSLNSHSLENLKLGADHLSFEEGLDDLVWVRIFFPKPLVGLEFLKKS